MEAHLYVRHFADVAGTATKSSSGRCTKSQYSASGIMADTNNIQRLGENRAAELAELRVRTAGQLPLEPVSKGHLITRAANQVSVNFFILSKLTEEMGIHSSPTEDDNALKWTV